MEISEHEQSVNLLKIDLINAEVGDCISISYEGENQIKLRFVKDKLSPSGKLKLVQTCFVEVENEN